LLAGGNSCQHLKNTASDLPPIKYRVSYSGKVALVRWEELKIGDKAILTITYGSEEKIESRTLKIYGSLSPIEQSQAPKD
jgi:hypothetical protein